MYGRGEVVISRLLQAGNKLKLGFTKYEKKKKTHKEKSQELNTSSTTLLPHPLPYPSETYVEI